MGPDHGAVDDEAFQIRVGGEMLMHQFPDTPVGPAGKPFVHAVPISILSREEPPLGAGTGHPQYSFYETSAFLFLANIQVGAPSQELENLGPFIWREFKS
jgi:hypothetical protein